MAGNQVPGDGLTGNLAGMSKNQLYDIMSQMKTIIEQNQQQARQILVQNPLLTKALFQAQIMLGMVQPPKTMPSIQPASSKKPQLQSPPQPAQQHNNQESESLSAQADMQDQPGVSHTIPSLRKQLPSSSPLSTSSVVTPPASAIHSQPLPSHTLPVPQQSKGHLNPQGALMSRTQSTQLSNAPPPFHSGSQLPSLHQSQMPLASSQLQQTTGTHMPLQPPIPPHRRPPSDPNFQRPYPAQGGPYFQYPGPHHPSQPIYHSGNRPPPSVGPSFMQGQPQHSNQPPPQPLYQGGSSHTGPDYSHSRSSMQMNRGSSWPPPHSENPAVTQLPGPSQLIPGQMGPGNQPSRPPPLTPDLEKALLQQVMSLTPEQINLLPPDQRNQILQLQQMLRQ